MWNMLIPAAVGLGSALIGSSGARSAANTAAAAANRAGDVQLQMFQQNREDLAPYREAGLRGLANYEAAVGPAFTASPGYEFARGEGIRAIDQGASARGMLNSGARLRELTRYGTGVANQEYGNYVNRLAALAGIGQTATSQTGALGANAAQGMANTLMQGGQAQAQGITGGVNAALGGVNAGLGLYGLMNPRGFGGWGNVAAQPAGANGVG